MRTFKELSIGDVFYRDLAGKPGAYRYVKVSPKAARTGGQTVVFEPHDPVILEVEATVRLPEV